jgi:T-complex protein 1 subunit zeta
MIGRAATAQDDIVGDGTTTNVLFIGELMRQAERYIGEGVHPRVMVDGIELAKKESLSFLDSFRVDMPEVSRDLLVEVARTSLNTKIHAALANPLTEVIVDAVRCIQQEDKPLDLHMVELMHMQHKMSTESKLIRGLVLDHGGRNSDMPSSYKNCYILNLNVSLEYEKTEVHSGFFWSNAEQRQKLIESERNFTDEKVMKIVELKEKLCKDNDKSFIIINQKGIDPASLEILSRHGICGIRRAKRRNAERIALACGGKACNSVDDLTEEDLGFAGTVYEQQLGDDKYTFVEDVVNPFSCTILIKGPNDYSIAQTRDAIKDGLRAVKNTIDDKSVIPGAGSFEVACHEHLTQYARKQVSGKAKLGVIAFAEALLVVPRTLAINSGFDAQDTLLNVQEAHLKNGEAFGVDVITGEPLPAATSRIWDNYIVKKQFLNIAPVLTQQLLLVDEVMRAGRNMKRGGPSGAEE